METRLTQLSYRLNSGELISLDQGTGWVLDVNFGHVWLTASDRSQDVWLRAGQHLALEGSTQIVIEAVSSRGDSQVTLRRTGDARTMPVSLVSPRVCGTPGRQPSLLLARLRRMAAAIGLRPLPG